MRMSSRLLRPLAAGAATALVIPAAIAFAPAASATTTVDTGDAVSTATLLTITSGTRSVQTDAASPDVVSLGSAQTVSALVANLSASTIQNPTAASVAVTPVVLNGTKFGTQTVSNGSQAVPQKSASVPGGVGLTTPGMLVQATTKGGPVAKLVSVGAFGAQILGLPLNPINGTVNFGSSVLNKTSDSAKTVNIKNFTLPSLSTLLAVLGVNINQLSTTTLRNLVNKLNLATSTIKSAENAVDAIAAAQAAVSGATALLNNKISAAPFSNATVAALLGTLGISAPANAADWQGLTGSQQSQLVTALNAATAGSGTAIQVANTALTTAQTALNNLINTVGGLADSLFGLLVGALNVSLLSIGELTVGTVADAGAKHVAQVTGSVKGVSVLGNQLIKSTDVLALGSAALKTVQSKVNALTATVGTVLNNATLAGLTGTLKVPAPKITLLQQSTNLNPVAGYQAAYAQVIGAAVSWGSLTIPTEGVPLARTNSAKPAITIDDNGNIVTDPLAVTVADLTDASRYAPAAATTPTTVTPTTPTTTTTPDLANTGVSTGVAVGALLLMFAAFGVRRLRNSVTADE